jgi:hypothetical protein
MRARRAPAQVEIKRVPELGERFLGLNRTTPRPKPVILRTNRATQGCGDAFAPCNSGYLDRPAVLAADRRRCRRLTPNPAGIQAAALKTCWTPAICSLPLIISWLTNSSLALALALNSTGKVIKENSEDEPKRIMPTLAMVGYCSNVPAINSQGPSAKPTALAARWTFAPSKGNKPPHPVMHAPLHGPQFQQPLSLVQGIPPDLAAVSWNEDHNDRSASPEWTQ